MTERTTRSRRSVFLGSLASAAAAAAIVWVTISRFGGSQAEIVREPREFPQLQGREVVVLDDEANRSYWGDRATEVPKRVDRWVAVLERLGMLASTVGSIAEWQDALLVLPHSYCLSEDDVNLVRDGIETGKGVVFVGPVGVRDSDATWLGWNRFHSIIGSTNLREFSGLETMFLVSSGTGPVGSESTAGHRISFLQREGQWGISGLPSAAYWADYDRKPFPTDELFHAAVVGTRGIGRFTWVGFDPDLAAAGFENQEAFVRLVADLVKWSLSVPAVEVDLYPGGRTNALIVAMDTEWQYENAAYLGDLLDARGIRGGFMSVNEWAADNADLVRSLAERHDIGSHSEDHTVFVGQPRRTQVARLRLSAAGLAELSGQTILGFRPPEERYDDVTIEALAETGFTYILGGEATAEALPVLLETSVGDTAASLVLIPRVQRDDLYLVNHEKLSDEELDDGWMQDWETVRRHRGIHYVSVHSTWVTSSEKAKLLGQFLDGINLDDVWVPGPNGLAEWWRSRSGIRAELRDDREGQVLLSVINEGTEDVADIGVWAMFEGNPRSVRTQAEGVEVVGPDDRGAYFFLLDHVVAGSTLTIPIIADGS